MSSKMPNMPVAPTHEITLWGVRKIVDVALRRYTSLHIAGLEQIQNNAGDQDGANRGAPQFKLVVSGSATGQMLKDLGEDLEKGIAKAGPTKWARWADVTIGGPSGSGEDATYEFILHMPPGVYVKQFWKENVTMSETMRNLEEKSVQYRHQDTEGNWYVSGHEERPDGTKDSSYTRKACPPNTKMVFGKCRKTQKTRWKEQQAAQASQGKSEEWAGTMREILDEAEAEATGTLDETVGASIVDRMAMAMLSAPKLEVLATRVFDDESQRMMFDGMITEPLRALIAKALDASGATVSGGLLAKAGREMKGVARGSMGEAVLSELGGQSGGRSRSWNQDPHWIVAKYAGKDKNGTPYKKGDSVFFYPKGKAILAGEAAKQAAAEFQGAVDDERQHNSGYGTEWY